MDYCRDERCHIDGLHKTHNVESSKADRCPACNAMMKFNHRCMACGWKSEWLLEQEQLRKQQVKKATGPRPKRPTPPPPPKRVVTTEAGVELLAEYTCPFCNGRGWIQNACNGCSTCHGKGVINKYHFMQYWHAKHRKDDES